MNIEITSSLKETINTILHLPHGFNFPISRNHFIRDSNITEEFPRHYIDANSSFSNPSLASSIVEEMLWQSYFINHTPNGSLLANNHLFHELETKWTFSCIHITSSLPDILKSGEIKLSSWCLPCTVYVTPYNNKVHNLTTSILSKELNATGKEYSSILFNFYNFKRKPNILMSWFDSQLLWELYFSIFGSTKHLLDSEEILLIEDNVIDQIKSLSPLLFLCRNYLDIEKADAKDFLNDFIWLTKQHGILGWLYFEAISEYIMFFQNDSETIKLKTIWELNNKNHKALIFDLTTHLKQSFNVSCFYPTLNEIVDFIKSKGFINWLDVSHFANFLKFRLAHMIRYKFDRWHIYENKSLNGHLTYFFIKEKPDFRAYYQSFYNKKKDLIQNQRNDNSVIFPYRSDIPKWEIWINPSIIDFEYEAFVVDIINDKISIKEKISVRLINEMVEKNRKNMTTK